MKNLLFGAAVALSLAVPAAAPAQRAPGALLSSWSIPTASTSTAPLSRPQTQLQSMGTHLQQRATQLGQPIETELQSIQQAANAAARRQAPLAPPRKTQLQQRAQRLDQQRNAAQQELARMEQNLRSTQANVIQQINTRLNPIINQVMTQRGANLAVDVGATLAHSGALNVTDQVLQQLNARLPSVTVAPMQQTQQPQQPQPGR